MLRLSTIFLFLSSISLLNLLRLCQIGPYWEVPNGIVGQMGLSAFLGELSLLISVVFFFIKIKNFTKAKLKTKIVFVVWILCAIVSVILIFLNGTPIDAFRIYDPLIQVRTGIFFLLGVVISCILMAILVRDYTMCLKNRGK